MMTMCSAFRLISHKIIRRPFPTLRRRKFCTAAVDEEFLRPSAPCLMLPPSFGGAGEMVYNFYSPTEGKVVSFNNRGGHEETEWMQDEHTTVVGSSHGWLALFNSVNHRMCLLNPLSGRRINLPPMAGKPFSTYSMSNHRIPMKVILSCSPRHEECRALMILSVKDRAATCRPGRGSDEWVPLDEWLPSISPFYILLFGDGRFYYDFVYSAARDRFFGVVYSGWCKEELECWDINGDGRQRMDCLHRFTSSYYPKRNTTIMGFLSSVDDKYLVYEEQSHNLFIVVVKRYKDDRVDDVDVYRFDYDSGGGVPELCSSLDDLVMFVGINHSFATKACRYPGLKPNSIYFSDKWHSVGISKRQTIEIFDYENKTCSPLYYPSRRQNHPSPMPWFTPTLD